MPRPRIPARNPGFAWIVSAVFPALAGGLFVGCAVISMEASPAQMNSLQTIRTFDGLSGDQLSQRVRTWAAINPDTRCRRVSVLTERLFCSGRGSTPMDFQIRRTFYYTMVIDFKDERIRISFENIRSHYDPEGNEPAGPNMKLQWSHVEGYFDRLKNELFRFIETGVLPADEGYDDDW